LRSESETFNSEGKPEMQNIAQNQSSDSAEPQTRCRVSFDGRITPPDAARVLNITERTLRDWRDRRVGPPAEYRMLWGCHWSYQLTDIYRHLLYQELA
jgi:DNA-binding transcriptional regulator YiaG